MKKLKEYFALSMYIIFHPADGFYVMKRGKQGKIGIIFLNVILFWLSYSFQKQYAGFAMNYNNPGNFNIVMDFVMVVTVFLLFCAGNWSITTLMDGEGRFVDIAMCLAYALTPVIMAFIPATIVSNVMVDTEKEFYFLVLGIAIAWSVMLAFMGILTVHDYTVGKTIATIFLTVIAMLIIIFIIGLIFSLMQQVYVFFDSIYTEIIYRM